MSDYLNLWTNGLLGGGLSDLSRPVTANRNMLAQGARGMETNFLRGILNTPWYAEFARQYGEAPDLNSPDYNYRAAWAQGVRPQPDPYDQGRYHWPSVAPSGMPLKSANHPTMWMETFMRATGKDPRALGIHTPQDAEWFLKNK